MLTSPTTEVAVQNKQKNIKSSLFLKIVFFIVRNSELNTIYFYPRANMIPAQVIVYLKPVQPQLHQVPQLHPVERGNKTDKPGSYSPVCVQQFGH